jgi:serine/threonine-protein kinase
MAACQICGFANRAGAKVCGGCGQPLITGPTCSNCGAGNRPQAQRCRVCGHPLTTTSARGTLLAGRYRIIKLIAQGGMGAVYQAEDTRIAGAVWAIKEMMPGGGSQQEIQEAIRDFQREADLLARLSHPNLARVTDKFEENGRHYLVMELVEGDTLESILNNSPGCIDPGRVLAWADQLCGVLEYLHRQRPPVIYRDMKPANAMEVRGTQTVKLIDFGIVRFFKPGQTRDTKALGTPGYAAPEQHGKGQSDARTDIYGLGVMLLQLMTGYDVENPSQPFRFPPARSLNPALSRQLEAALGRAVQYNPAQRFQSVAEFRRALRACPEAMRPAASKARPVPTPPPAPQPATSRKGPKPASAVKPAPAVATFLVSPNPVTLSRVNRWSRTPPTATLQVTGIGTTRGVIRADKEWLGVEPARFGPNQNVTVTVDPRQVSMERARVTLLNVWNRARRGPVANLLSTGRARHRDSMQQLLVFAASMSLAFVVLVVAGVAQAVLWLVVQHTRYLLVAPTLVTGNLQFKSPAGTINVPVHVEVVPSRLELALRWLTVVTLVAAEIGLVLWTLLQVAR